MRPRARAQYLDNVFRTKPFGEQEEHAGGTLLEGKESLRVYEDVLGGYVRQQPGVIEEGAGAQQIERDAYLPGTTITCPA
jgi:hypothetical protein